MNNHPVPAPAPAPTPAVVGQATAVEQSRAVAEVQAAVVVAQQVPRSIATARSEMQASCEQPRMAERAFFRYARAGSQITGPSVHLARELARCFGNVQYGISELRRDDVSGQSEMQAWAWDVQTNTRASTTFIVPHKRDKKGGPVSLVDMRDIYENNANHGARRLREQIFAILPEWFVDEAKDRCRATIEKGDGKPLAESLGDAVRAFEALGVTEAMITRKYGRQVAQMTAHDLAALRITYRSINRGEVQVEDEFPDPAPRPTAATPPKPEATQAAESPAENDDPVEADDHDPKVLEAEIRAAVKANKNVTITSLTKHFEVGTLEDLAAEEALAIKALHWISQQ